MPTPSLVDRMFLAADSAGTPQNVAFLAVFEKPAHSRPDFVASVGAELGGVRRFTSPLNYRIAMPGLGPLSPSYRVLSDDDIDLDFHLRLHLLSAPGGERQLGALVSRLHSATLDLTRPPWEFHLIDGLDHNRFAVYFKIHHALMDGVAGSQRLEKMLDSSPDVTTLRPIWAVGEPEHDATTTNALPLARNVRDACATVGRLTGTAVNLMRDHIASSDPDLATPFDIPASPLNGRVGPARRVATQTFDHSRFRALAKLASVTHNDILLTVCSGGLRRYLAEIGGLPSRSLVAGTPVNIRSDAQATNAFTMAVMRLATDCEDPRERLRAVNRSSTLAKRRLKAMPTDVVRNYASLFMGPFIAANLVGLGGRTTPPYNVSISNVPGSAEVRYFAGARLIANYPLAVLFHGVGLFIAAMTLSGHVGVGFVGDETTVPHLQRLATFTSEAFDELEKALGAADA